MADPEATVAARPHNLRDRGAGVDRWALTWVGSVHLLAALAPFTFTWTGFATAAGLHLVTGLAITIGYHRLFSHRSLVAVRPVRWLLGLLACLAGHGGPLRWTAIHRLHHRHSDRPDDPQHSGEGWWEAYFGWVVATPPEGACRWRDHAVVADLRRDPDLRFFEAAHMPFQFLVAGVLIAAGWVFGGWSLAISLVTWGVGVRVVVSLHMLFLLNLFAHRSGYRNYETPDHSRNVWWLFPFLLGECWHNNHHARPRSAEIGHRWFELDPAYAIIRVLGWLGLVTRIVSPTLVESRSGRVAPKSWVVNELTSSSRHDHPV